MRIVYFDVYKELLKEKSGLDLKQDHAYLLRARLSPVARKWGYPSLEAMTVALQGVPDKDLVHSITEAMTFGDTSFFRDLSPFHTFHDDVLPYLIKTRIHQRKFNLWCAGAASGQESYSLAMLLKEAGGLLSGWKTGILATDIADGLLEQAKAGIYSQFEIQCGLSVRMLLKFFTQDNDGWQIVPDIRKAVNYQHFNLLDAMDGLGSFDVIFCRNVLSYFDDATQADVLRRMAKQLAPDGLLFLGYSEALPDIQEKFTPLPGRSGIYAPAGHPLLDTETGEASQALAQ